MASHCPTLARLDIDLIYFFAKDNMFITVDENMMLNLNLVAQIYMQEKVTTKGITRVMFFKSAANSVLGTLDTNSPSYSSVLEAISNYGKFESQQTWNASKTTS